MIKPLHSPWFSLVLLALAVWLGVAALNIGTHKRETAQELRDRQAKVASLERENDTLARFADYFKSADFLEKEARLKLHYKVEGEEVVYVYKDRDVRKASASAPFQQESGFWSAMKRWVEQVFGQ